MAQDIVSGLFGLQPWQIQQQQNQMLDRQASEYAQLQPMQRAAMGMYRSGARLGGMLGGAIGMVDPAVQEAQQRQAALQGLDMSSPEAILQRASQIQDPRLKMQLQMLAQQRTAEMQKMRIESQKAALAERKQDFSEQEAFELKKMEAEARIRQNDQRIADARTTAQERMELQRENNQIKMLIASMRSGNAGMTAGELREQKYKDAKEKEAQEKVSAAKSGLEALDAVKRNVLDLYDEKTEKLKPAASALFGRVDQYRGPLTLSEESANALSSLTGLKDQITMTNLADAKKMVGQSFGSMQVQEWDKFVRLLASLDRSIGEEKAASNLKYILDFIKNKSEVLEVALGAGKGKPPVGGSGSAPSGVDPKVWAVMTAEEKALWK